MRKQVKMMQLFALVLLLLTVMFLGRMIFRGLHKTDPAVPEDMDVSMRYPYQQLEPREQELYSVLYAGIASFQENITLPDRYTDKEYERVYLLLEKQEPQFFYLESTYELAAEMESVQIYYKYEKKAAESMLQALQAAAKRILERLSPTQTEGQKLLMIHDAIAEGCQYAAGFHSDDAYGCLVDGVAQCEGYAKAFLYVARSAGISTMCVTGKSKSGIAHVWNLARIGGAYYQFDVTWDDDDSYQGQVVHSCFAMPDDLFSDHIADKKSFLPPECTGLGESYYQKNGLVLNESGHRITKLQEWLSRNETHLEFHCATKAVYLETKKALQSDEETMNVVQAMRNGQNWQVIGDEARQNIIILW